MSKKVPFKVSARAGKLLGRENFSNPEGAIMELVKNSYDADAENCLVIFDVPIAEKKDGNGKIYNVPVKEESKLYIIDNGHGMLPRIIEDYWMQIGTGNKEQFFLSEKKRIKTGAKGIGRFALDRLGYNTEMWTLAKDTKTEKTIGSYWSMDWNQFDYLDRTISDIEAELDVADINIKDKISELIGPTFNLKQIDNIKFDYGTVLRISNLKDEWFPADVNGVYTSLEALIPPKELNIPFSVYFKHCQEPNKYGHVNTAFFNDYDYRVIAKFNAGTLIVNFEITRNELDLKVLDSKYRHIFEKLSPPFNYSTLELKTFSYEKPINKILNWELSEPRTSLLKEVGDFQFTFHYIKLINSRKEGYPFKNIIPRERRATLERFGGIKIYRDSFRVRPYGDPNNDWLGLGFRAAKSPAGAGQRIGDWRVNSESVAGIITISRKSNPLLIDKSDRGALQENDAFDTFKKIIIGIIHEFEVDRSRILNPIFLYNKKEKERKKEEEIQKRAEEIAKKIVAQNNSHQFDPKDDDGQEQVEEFIKESFRNFVDQNKEDENQELVQVRSLASLGLVVSSFSHELKEVSNNSSEILSLEKIYKSIVPDDKKKSIEYIDGIDIIELLKEDREKIKHWVDYSLTAIRKDKRTRTNLDLAKFFNKLNEVWKRIFKRKDIKFNLINSLNAQVYDFRAFEMDMTTILSNLINNSIDSFEQRSSVADRSITIEYSINGNKIEIVYSDNGNGIDDSFENKEDIFLPFTTSKRDRKGNEIGTGLGMYLVKSVVDDNNGTIDILEPDNGFSILITFPILRR